MVNDHLKKVTHTTRQERNTMKYQNILTRVLPEKHEDRKYCLSQDTLIETGILQHSWGKINW